VELPLTIPELYEDIGIKPPKVGTPLSLALFCVYPVWCAFHLR
jgi:hypothetical protein